MPERVSEDGASFLKRTNKGGPLDKSDLAGVFGDHKDANVIALGVSRIHKEADSLRVISLRSPDDLFSISEAHLDCPAIQGCAQMQGIVVFGFGSELPHEENRLQVLHRNLYFLPLKWVLLGG